MFFLIAAFVVGLVVSLVAAPKTKLQNAESGKLNDFSFPRADYGSPVPRWYGTAKFKAPNTIWSGDFKAEPIKKKVKTGLFSSKKQITGYKYKVGFDLAVALGPNFKFRRLWAGKYELWNGCMSDNEMSIDINLPELFGGQDRGSGGFVGRVTLYDGSFKQTRNAYLARVVDPNIPAYVGVAHMVFEQPYIGNQTTLQPIYVEGSCFTDSLGIGNCMHIMPNKRDANPVEILYDLYVNGWGNLDIDPALINKAQWVTVAKKIYAEGNGMSLVVANASKGGEVTREILSQINANLFQDPVTGLFDLTLLRDDYKIADLPVLSPDNVIAIRAYNKMLWSETYNRVRVKFTDRANGYKENSIAVAEDFANIRFQRVARSTEVTFPGIYDADLANEIAARELSNLNVPLYSFELILDRTTANLRPGQPFVFQWPEYGIALMVCRIRKFDLGTLDDGEITASVVQDQFAVNSTVIAPPSGSTYTPPSYNPQAIDSYKVFELPYFLEYNSQLGAEPGTSRLAVFAKAPSSASIGFNASIVGTEDDAEVLSVAPYSDNAKLAEDLGKYDGFVNGVLPTLTIKEFQQGGDTSPLFEGGEGTARMGRGLFLIRSELMAFETYTTNDDGTVTLKNVHRALLDTTYGEAKTDDRVFFFDGQEGFANDTTPNNQAVQLYLRDVAMSGTFTGDVPLIDATPKGRADMPLPADFLALDGVRAIDGAFEAGSAPVLSWRARNRLAAPTAVEFEPDAAEADEAGATYALDYVMGDAILSMVEPIASGDALALPDVDGPVTLRLWTKRDGLKSFSPAEYPIVVYSADAVKIDDDLITIDGETVVISDQ